MTITRKLNYSKLLHYSFTYAIIAIATYCYILNKGENTMKQKLNNGVHAISNAEYHTSEGLSRSALWEFKRSPWHYWNKYLNPDAVQQKSTKCMKLGELVHALVLEPTSFADRYIVEPNDIALPKVELLRDVGRDKYERQKKAREETIAINQAFKEKFNRMSIGKEVIASDIYAEAKATAKAVLNDKMGQDLFTNVKTENSIYFTHGPTGLQVKCRPDAWVGSVVTDLKTAKDASYRAFQATAHSSGYFMQAAIIRAGLASVGITLEKFVFYCVEKTPGYPCVYYILDDEAINHGMNQFNNSMQKLAICLDNGDWPGYNSQILTIPNYANNED